MRRWIKDVLSFLDTLRRLRPHMRPGRTLFIVTVSLAVAGFAFDLAVSGILVVLLQGLDPSRTTPSSMVGYLSYLPDSLHASLERLDSPRLTLVFCAGALFLLVAKNLLMYASVLTAARMKRRSGECLRTTLFSRLMSADIVLFESRKSGEVAEVFHQETFRAVMMLDYLLMLMQRSCLVLVYVTGILSISWVLSLVTVLLVGMVAAIISVFYSRLKQWSEQLTRLYLEMAGRVGEVFAGVRVIRTTHSEGREEDKFRDLTRKVGAIEEQVTRGQGLMVPLSETGVFTCGLLILGGAYWFMVVPGYLSAARLFLFCVALARLLPTVPQVYSLFGQCISLAGGLKELLNWLELPSFPKRKFGAVTFSGIQHSLRFEALTYRYPGSTHEALSGFELEIPAGKTIALVGASGSGKSTTAGLLLRFREPTQGRITVDGRDYWEFTAESWHRNVAVVEQEAFLFHDTIRQNLRYGCESADDAAIDRAVADAQLHDAIQQKSTGLDTVVGERGISLSGGQRQRLAIARALVRDPKLLILDEATSALDNVKERQVQAALEAARHGRTVVIIAHRLSTIRHSDKIAVLDHGHVLEEGTWDELMARRGAFAKLVEAAEADHRETL